MITTKGIYSWSFVTQIFHSGQPSHGGDRKTGEEPLLNSFLVSSNHLSKISTEIYIYTPHAGAAGMLLHINGQFTIGKLISSLLS